MASPPAGYSFPPTAHSPPYPSHSQLPPINTKMNKKRASEGGASGPSPSLKRRKPSTVSVASGAGGGSAHPLRQTANARDEVGTPFTERSPSVDIDNMSFVSGSQVSAAGPPKKKRGRKSKADKAREQTPSAVSGRMTVAGSEVGGRGSASLVAADDGADVPEDEGPIEVTATENFSMEQRQEEKQRMHILVNALSPDQFHRLENYRASGLAKASIRRLINQTISQSVSENIVIASRTISKLHLGSIIESARRIQQEWIAKTGEKQTDLPTPPPELDGVPILSDARNPGPLRPEHLREAVRRHKLAYEAGGVGLNQTWYIQNQSGIERFPMRTGGRRIFR
ncbi:hTAFII28-like protein conserved region-domain-containing protein [Rhypophila decipiens]|uniref:HTAFII28-like protein conserved region-domain-containing protein n=1 Tax=Rhypophila decipiens TaxID=261697 RepID=A0AAN6Y0C3_9PEZI|nr:hTAFII28-like protein conserved region-domain-containing protein [Rhypophila decipiens]